MTIKVTWIDEGGVWRLAAGDLVSGRVDTSGDGDEKTTTFELPGEAVVAAGRSFALEARQNDLVVSLVRVVK
ncbi:MAG: hypothetical protein HC871_01400 [Rhizobiales bacterium]|nr:hypothetical protein [Hyphomicrobiales bacterium]